MFAIAAGASGATCGIWGESDSASGIAGYFTNGGHGGYALVTGGGNVGIGTVTPTNVLHVYTATTGSGTATVASLQNGSATCLLKPGTGAMTTSCSSDIRLKKDIVDTGDVLAGIGGMRIRDYTVKADNVRMTGVIAQELLKAHPDMVHEGEDGFYKVDAPNPWKLVKAIQELKADNDNLKAANDNEKAEIGALHQEFEAYKAAHK